MDLTMHFTPLSDGARRYRLSVPHGDESFLEGYDVFVIDITPESAHDLLERLGLLAAAHTKDKAAYELYFWETAGDFFAADYDSEETTEPPPPAGEPSRTECEQLIVRLDEVAWFAYPRHGDDHLITEAIPRSVLLEIAGTTLDCRRQ